MRCPPTRAETLLLAGTGVLFLIALFAPAVALPPEYHHFADRRLLPPFGFGLDVLSNLPFAIAAMVGMLALWRVPSGTLGGTERSLVGLFLAGLLLTALGSAWYHLAPGDGTLVTDRCAMAVAFAGLLGLAAAQRVSTRAGALLGITVLLLGPLTAVAAHASGNNSPWALLQGGGIVLLLAVAFQAGGDSRLPVHWGPVLLAYAGAKLLEMNDAAVFELTSGWVSGHSLKHAIAALAAVPVIVALGKHGASRQNADQSATAPGKHRAFEPAQEEIK